MMYDAIHVGGELYIRLSMLPKNKGNADVDLGGKLGEDCRHVVAGQQAICVCGLGMRISRPGVITLLYSALRHKRAVAAKRL